MIKKKICVLVLNRSEYSRMRGILKLLQSDVRVDLITIVLVSPQSDNRILLKRDGLPITRTVKLDSRRMMVSDVSKSVGTLVQRFGELFVELNPDIVLIHGDRYEALAAAVAATFSDMFIAHLQGGEVSGTLDEHSRHAITKLSHLHLTSTVQAADRVVKLGEKPEMVICVGCPGTDLLLSVPALSFAELRYQIYLEANNRTEVLEKLRPGYFLVMQSPVTTELGQVSSQILATLNALLHFQQLKIILLPNPDVGGEGVVTEIRKFTRGRDDTLIFKHLPPEVFVNTMRHAAVLIGNSSAFIRESGYFGVPTVNVGSRQSGRDRSRNIVDVENDTGDIVEAINRQLSHGTYSVERLYGDGGASGKIIELLVGAETRNKQKRLAY